MSHMPGFPFKTILEITFDKLCGLCFEICLWTSTRLRTPHVNKAVFISVVSTIVALSSKVQVPSPWETNSLPSLCCLHFCGLDYSFPLFLLYDRIIVSYFPSPLRWLSLHFCWVKDGFVQCTTRTLCIYSYICEDVIAFSVSLSIFFLLRWLGFWLRFHCGSVFSVARQDRVRT